MTLFNEFNNNYSRIQYAVGFVYKEGTSDEAAYTLGETDLNKTTFKTLKNVTVETDLYNNKQDVIKLIKNYEEKITMVSDNDGAFSDFLKTIHNGDAPTRFVRQQVRNMEPIPVQVEYAKSVKPVYSR